MFTTQQRSEQVRSLFLEPSTSVKSLSWVQIDRQALAHNLSLYRSVVPPSQQLSVVLKSNAYGHGLPEVAMLCDSNNDVDVIAVVSVQEAMLLRTLGIKKPILVLSILDGNLAEAIEHNIDLVVYDQQSLHRVLEAAQKISLPAQVHLKIDTGLSRLGVTLPEVPAFATTVAAAHHHIRVRGIFTHLADSEQADHHFVHHQIATLKQALNIFSAHAIRPPLTHAECSAAITAISDNFLTLARLGIGLYGLWPSPENKERVQKIHPHFNLKPVLSWFTKISQLKEIDAGNFVGYDRTFQTTRPTKLAILPIGYWDGYDRRFSNNGIMLINGQLAPVRGRVAMNMTIVDVTDISDVTHDSIVTLLGNHEGVSAQDLAARCNTINYEVVTRINPLLPRIVV
jgi:alanine racemase